MAANPAVERTETAKQRGSRSLTFCTLGAEVKRMMHYEAQRVLQMIVHDPYVLLLVLGSFMLLAYGLWCASRLNLQSPTNEPPEISFADILLWAQTPETSIAQVKQVYNWQMSQWSAASTALLTSFLGFISAAVLGYFKGDFKVGSERVTVVLVWGTLAAGLMYFVCQDALRNLRRQFISLYRLLDVLR